MGRKVIAAALLGATAVAALHDTSAHSDTPGRVTYNHGTATFRRVSSFGIADEIPHPVKSFNAQGKAECSKRTALAFLKEIHPEQTFRLQSVSDSKASGIDHFYFVQTVSGIDVVDGLVQVHVDKLSKDVLAYHDSAYVNGAHLAAECEQHLQDIAYHGDQMVFATQFTPSDKAQRCIDAAMAPAAAYDMSTSPLDPRIAVVSFLLSAYPHPNTAGFVAASASFEELVDSIVIEHDLHSESAETMPLTMHNVPGAEEPVKARLGFVQREDGSGLVLTWSLEYRSIDNWYEAHVAAEQNPAFTDKPAQIMMMVDWMRSMYEQNFPRLGKIERIWEEDKQIARKFLDLVKGKKDQKHEKLPRAAYKVFPWGMNDPTEGKRREVKHPHDPVASEFGWHIIPSGAGRDSGSFSHEPATYPDVAPHEDWLDKEGWSKKLNRGASFADTRGNNVFAQENWSGGSAFELNHRPNALSKNMLFDWPLGWGPRENRTGKVIPAHSYIDASVTELFFTCNEIHDLFLNYGFDEISGNFQAHNFGRGGLGGDPVIAMAQDGSGTNNANFATPPDGNMPRMRMYVWTTANPNPDGDLEAGIVIHEYAHGISTRLTGGPANSGCLGWGEAGGAGEGWGDWFATMIRMKDAKVQDWTMGEWASGRKGGIRQYPYSMNMTTDPATYKTLDGPGYFGVHAIGFVFAEMLFVAAENMIAKHGFSSTLFPPPVNSTQAVLDDFWVTNEKTGKRIPKHGNTLMIQIVLDGMKLQPCRPSFFDIRDAIFAADKALTGGDNYCLLLKSFASRGLGLNASLKGALPWGGGIRTEDFAVPAKCRDDKD